MNNRWKLMPAVLVLVVLLVSLLATYAAGQEPGTTPQAQKDTSSDTGPSLVNPRAGEAAVARLASLLEIQTFTSQDTPIDIPDEQCISSTITVPDPLQFADLEIGLNISHTNRLDLEIWLTAPSGQAVELLTQAGAGYPNLNVLFDDESPYDPRNWMDNDAGQAVTHTLQYPPYEWTWFSEGMYYDPGPPLHSLYPDEAQGDWTLQICDAAELDVGTLNWWALEFSELAGPYLYDSYKMGADAVAKGSPLTYTLVVTNSVGTAASAVLTDPLPADTYLLPGSLTCDSGACAYDMEQAVITWSGDVPVGAPATIEFAVGTEAVSCGSQIVNSAVVTDPALDLGPAHLDWTAWAWDLQPYGWDFEADDGGFTGTKDWAWAAPTYPSRLAAHSGSWVWATNPAGLFNLLGDVSVLTRTVDLSAFPGQQLTLSWWQYFQSDSDYDYAEVKIIDSLGDSHQVYSLQDQGYVDTIDWVQESVDVSAYAGQEITLRFEFHAKDWGVNYAGWYLDDISVFACQAPEVIQLEPAVQAGSGCPFGEVVYNFEVVNTELTPQRVELSLDGGTFASSVEPSQAITLTQNERAAITVTVEIPAQPGVSTDVAYLHADSEAYSDVATIATSIGDNCPHWFFFPWMPHNRTERPSP
ncbi:MAG: proprotein convertase P-domain-containing protein [Anaerolineae bacterium]|jgi:uncharacterized repeat protein (TIGR01451 family)